MTGRITDPAHKADPFPFYEELRRRGPIHRLMLAPRRPIWLVVRYAEAAAALADRRLVKNKQNALPQDGRASGLWMPKFARPLLRNMLDLDEPDHARLRALVNQAFTRQRVESHRERIEWLAAEQLDSVRDRPTWDLIRHYAQPIPTTVIAEMLGVPTQDRHRFSRWSRAIVAADTSSLAMLRAVPGLWSFLRYVRQLLAMRRRSPSDDLLSALVEAEAEGQRLDDDELVAMVFLLLVAGHETTVNLIGNGLLALLHHRDQWERLRDESDLLNSTVEELLRFAGPLETATERYAGEPIAWGDVTIPRGALVYVALASANRDSETFDRPDTLDICRQPNPHLAFGLGPHYCLGAPLARLEAQVAFRTLVSRYPTLQLAVPPQALRWRRGLVLRGLRTLPVGR